MVEKNTDSGEYYRSWSLGDDYDCETCGYTWNTLRFEELDDDLWCLSMLVGCYGGDYTMSNDADFLVKVEEIIMSALKFPDFDESDGDELRAILAKTVGITI